MQDKTINKNIKPLKIVFCIPGNNYSGRFFDCWTSTISHCLSNGIQPLQSIQESQNIYTVRNLCLYGALNKNQNQKPFDGRLDYDYLMWIDSDTIFKPSQIIDLIKHKRDIVSGLCIFDGKHFAVVKKSDEIYFKKKHIFKHMTKDDIKNQNTLIEASFVGFGFILIKKGVFESMDYPWFRPLNIKIGKVNQYSTEDYGFCVNARKLGYKIYADPKVIVGHE